MEKRLIKITKNLSKKRRASVCMRTNYDQTLLEQAKIFDPHTYCWSVQHEKTRFCGFGKIKESVRESFQLTAKRRGIGKFS